MPLRFDEDGILRQSGRALLPAAAAAAAAAAAVTSQTSSEPLTAAAHECSATHAPPDALLSVEPSCALRSATAAGHAPNNVAADAPNIDSADTVTGPADAGIACKALYPVPSPLWAAGFSFSDSSMLQEVPYDPLLPQLFFGEEISMAARSGLPLVPVKGFGNLSLITLHTLYFPYICFPWIPKTNFQNVECPQRSYLTFRFDHLIECQLDCIPTDTTSLHPLKRSFTTCGAAITARRSLQLLLFPQGLVTRLSRRGCCGCSLRSA